MTPAAPVTTTLVGELSMSGQECSPRPAVCNPPLSSSAVNRFESWLATTDFGVAVKEFPQGTRTAGDAARAVGCEVGQIVKSLVFVAGGGARLGPGRGGHPPRGEGPGGGGGGPWGQ